jgi:hypothetical protein
LYSNVGSVLNYPFVKAPDDVLNQTKLLKELCACLENFLTENILLSVHPEVWEALLGRVQNLG